MKNTYWFPHDLEPTADPKIQAMLGQYGASGYGLYWRIVEMLHSEDTHKLPLKNYLYLALAKQMSTRVEKVSTFINSCIRDFELFATDEKLFWSNRVNKNIGFRQDISEKRSKAGKKSAAKRSKKATSVQQNPTSVEQKGTNGNTGQDITLQDKTKEESKEAIAHAAPMMDLKESNLFRQPNIPFYQKVLETFIQSGGTEEMAKKFFNGHESTGWFLKGSPITNFSNLVSDYIKTWKGFEKNNSSKSLNTPSGPPLKKLQNIG